MTDAAFTQLTVVAAGAATVATSFITLIVQIYREGRARKWALEDAALLATKVQDEADRVAEKLDAEHALSAAARTQVAEAIHEHRAVGEQVIVALAENTVKTEEGTAAAKKAYNEANHANEKLEQLGIAHVGVIEQATTAISEFRRRSTDK